MYQRNLMTGRARALRKAMTEPEVLLWTRLRGRSGDKPTFRRQHPIGSIVVDFYCPAARLAVEIDGSTHCDDEARARDAARDAWLRRQGIEVLRLPAGTVYREIGDVVDGVLRVAEARRAQIQLGPLSPSTTGSSAGGPPPAIASRRGR